MGEHPTVARVDDRSGSFVEPPLDQNWTQLEKLRWHLAVNELDYDIRWTVTELSPGMFALSTSSPGGSSGVAAQPFRQAWDFITALGFGAETYALQPADTYAAGVAAGRAEAQREAVEAIERRRNEHWLQHLRDHPLADGRSCPGDYGKHDAYRDAANIVAALDSARPSVPPCPECANGKHRNCDEQTLDPATDQLVPCPCKEADHA